jgi:hypothetical protein
MKLHLLFDPRREHLPPRPHKIAAARAQGLSRLAALCAATRQGLAFIGPSTAASLVGREESMPACPLPNRWFLAMFTPLLTFSVARADADEPTAISADQEGGSALEQLNSSARGDER